MKKGNNNFNKLPNLYVITILNFDLFHEDYMMYTFHNQCVEAPQIEYNDGLKFIYFYTGGHKGGSEVIQNLLRYLENSTYENVTDETTRKLHEYVQKVKKLPEVRDSYMTWDMYIDLMKEEEREIGRKAGEEIGRKAGEEIGRKAGEEIGRKAGEEIGRKAGEEIGRKAGEEIGRRTGEATNLISLVRRKLEKGKNQTIIADELEETEEKISMIYGLLMEKGDKTDEELAVIMLESRRTYKE
jgi:hypothetical protein